MAVTPLSPPLWYPTLITKPKDKRLTFKQKRFTQELVANGGNATQAALEAYDTDKSETARAIGSQNLTKANVQQELARVLKEEDVTLKRAVGRIGKELGGDHGATALRAADMTLKLLDAYPRRRVADHRHAHLHLAILRGLEELSDEELDENIATAQRRMRVKG